MMTSDERRKHLKLENPYLISLAKKGVRCPRCLKLMELKPSMSPNGAVGYCSCGNIEVIDVPEAFWVPENTGSYDDGWDDLFGLGRKQKPKLRVVK